jgi:hypothetical protein
MGTRTKRATHLRWFEYEYIMDLLAGQVKSRFLQCGHAFYA